MDHAIPGGRVMTAASAVFIYGLLESADVRTWLNGGWGVDALVGRQTRDHDDIDLFVESSNVEELRRVLGLRGFNEVPGGRPANFVLRNSDNHEVDVHVFEIDTNGDGVYPMANGTSWVVPASGLQGTGVILGRKFRCFTPELQLQCYSGYEFDDNDRHDLAILHSEFPNAVAVPEVIRLTSAP